jgi:BlaI family penicillinase repressor
MKKRAPLTGAELEILRVLWRRGASTVREVFEALESRGTGYTTVLKLMQIMAQKGLVHRDEREKTHVYRAAVAAASTERKLVKAFIDKAFEGSTSRLVMSALSAKPASKEELDEIRALLDDIEGQKGDA